MVLKGATTNGGGQCGFMGMAVLGLRFAPKGGVRALKKVLEVINPIRIKDVKWLRKWIMEWETSVSKLEVDFGEKLSDVIKMAGFMQLIPDQLKTQVFDFPGFTNMQIKYLCFELIWY
jgi:hypothetical protein